MLSTGVRIRKSLGAWYREQRKLFRFLRVQRWTGYPQPTDPAFDEQATAQFLRLLNDSTGYLEFGAGGSTLAADRLHVPTLTVEGDRFYARCVRAALSPNTSVEIMDMKIGATREWSRPLFTRPYRWRLRRWRRYSHEPFRRLDQLGWFPDFVLVDGRFRRACVLESARQALLRGRSLTIMVDDYFKPGRDHYHAVERWVGEPMRVGMAAIFRIDAKRSTLEPIDTLEAAADYR